MKLEDLATGAPPVPLTAIGADSALARRVQQRLADAGLLDPPVDGAFGPVSMWAIGQFMRAIGTPSKTQLDLESARALVAGSATTLFPLNPADSFAGRIAAALVARGHWINRHPDCVNIVYIEGVDPDGTPNSDAPNEFNDLRLLLRVNKAGNPAIVESWDATTEPGRHFVMNPMDPNGAARIAFGQYKAWAVGTHMAGRPSAHEALVQTQPVKVHRDLDKNFERDGDRVFEGVFGINQHWGFDLPKGDIGRASAGCLVGRTKKGHRDFMALVKADPRYETNHGYRFMATVLRAADVSL